MDGTWVTLGVNEKLEGREERREGVRGKPSLGVGTAGECTGAPSTRSQAAARTSEGASSMWRASKDTRQPRGTVGLTPRKPAATNESFVTSRSVNGGGDGMWQRCRIKSRA